MGRVAVGGRGRTRSPRDPLHLPGDPGTHWSTVNVGEALPGVATPLGWSIWSDIGDRMCRDLSYAIGVFDAAERRQPPPGPDRIISVFHGRTPCAWSGWPRWGTGCPAPPGRWPSPACSARPGHDRARHRPVRRDHPADQRAGRAGEATGVGDVGVLSGTGGAEMRMVQDIWRAFRGQLTVDDVVAAHGYHGPGEGEISSSVWRECPAPLGALIERYAARDESTGPLARELETRAKLPAMRAELLAALPAPARPAVRGLLAHAARTVPLRGLGKASFLRLANPSDVWYLTVDEVLSLPAGVTELVAYRRAKRARVPGPEPALPLARQPGAELADQGRVPVGGHRDHRHHGRWRGGAGPGPGGAPTPTLPTSGRGRSRPCGPSCTG